MAVLLKVEQRFPDGTTHVVPTLYPTGRTIEKEERERAERLDAFLSAELPRVAKDINKDYKGQGNTLRKWHALGKRLAFVDDPSLVSINDRDSGIVWLAMRQYLPADLLPTGDSLSTPAILTEKLANIEGQRRLGKRHDHFERCYKLGKYPLSAVDWLTWSDFDAFLESPGLERDSRILPLLADRARRLSRRLKRAEVRMIFKNLREAIPTKHKQRDTSALDAPELSRLIDDAFLAAGLSPGASHNVD